jgi:hypothetical protein
MLNFVFMFQLSEQGTTMYGSIKHLLHGKVKNYIRCVNIQWESSNYEDFSCKFSTIITQVQILAHCLKQ